MLKYSLKRILYSTIILFFVMFKLNEIGIIAI